MPRSGRKAGRVTALKGGFTSPIGQDSCSSQDLCAVHSALSSCQTQFLKVSNAPTLMDVDVAWEELLSALAGLADLQKVS
jgi:hypothetical protein